MGVHALLVGEVFWHLQTGETFGSEVHGAGTDGSHHPKTPRASPEKWIYCLMKIGGVIPAARRGFQCNWMTNPDQGSLSHQGQAETTDLCFSRAPLLPHILQ